MSLTDGPILLDPDHIHVWLAFYSESPNDNEMQLCNQLLTSEEQAWLKHLKCPSGRYQYALTRVLTRTVLSRYATIKPHEWRFTRNPNGRPQLLNDDAVPNLSFNISHTKGLIALALALRCSIGIDVENIERQVHATGIADRFFSLQESNDLRSYPEHKRADRFFQYWTLKESYLKAIGKGLTVPLDQICFLFLGESKFQAKYGIDIQESAIASRFFLFNPSPTHVAAVCAQRADHRPVKLIFRSIIPFQADTAMACPTMSYSVSSPSL